MGTTLLKQSLSLLFVFALSACERRSSLSEQRKTLRDPTPVPVEPSALPVAASASTARPTALPVDAISDPRAPEPFPVAPKDLPLDPEALARTVRDRFHAPTPVRVEPDGFVLIGIGRTPLFDDADRLIHRALTAYFHDRFATPPARPVSIFFFSARTDYDAWCRERYGASGADYFGFYDRTRRELVVDASGGAAYLPTLTHEIVHPIVEADFPDAPKWLDEGLGTLFEAPTFGAAGEIHGAAWNRRYPRLRAALDSPVDSASTRLDALFGMSNLVFAGIEPDAGVEGAEEDAAARAQREARMLLHYAMARYACWWLDERRQLWPFYRAWRDGFARDPTGEKAFADVVGKTPAQANAEWVRSVRRLGAPATP